ncbi:energy transducer TonB [Novosphingobium mangrovi (ex Huang et al. 2023)]|uniref:Energy transducer TonB n=1 Tax=Novosphingobium mangrovi (ex Huang et al. 2023) TaxID=2976432 RepID=A0ABT2I0W9_9SPHN|nr:energy transducer TonB [Novosphingobium mangrovi (ex Huang et al. 2023)]MCT2398439.1 energy transducer TonB [Novosphingobium mangrovi (ex Huang et al. 2023)]
MTMSTTLDPVAAARRTGVTRQPERPRGAPVSRLPVGDEPVPVAPCAGEEDVFVSSGRGGYRTGGFSLRSFLIVGGIHLVAIAGLLGLGVVAAQPVERKHLTVFNVASPPPSPDTPPQPDVQPEPAQIVPDVAAVQPLIELPSKSPVRIAAAPVVPATSPVRVDAPPAPASPPAPPAPVTPPDFSAAQLNNPGPTYPYMSRRNREEGTVLLKVLVTAEGQAGTIEIRESSGFERLDHAALKTVRKWRFVPAMQAGKPVSAWVIVPVGFSLS